MELHQLEYFVAVADQGSFTRAAEAVHVAQPGVSAQVKRLEREWGEPLFERTRSGATLTGAGVAALAHARAALAAADAARDSVAEVAGLVRGRVVVGTVSGGRGMDLPGLIAGFHHRFPEVAVSLVEDGSDALLQRLHDSALNLAWIGRSTAALPSGVLTRTVVDERLCAVVAHSHPLAGRRSVRTAELARHPLICLPAGTGSRDALEAGARTAGVRLPVAFETAEPLLTAELARHGLGIGVVPASAAEHLRDRLSVLPVVAPVLRSRLELAWVGGPGGQVSGGPATRALVAYALDFCDSPAH